MIKPCSTSGPGCAIGWDAVEGEVNGQARGEVEQRGAGADEEADMPVELVGTRDRGPSGRRGQRDGQAEGAQRVVVLLNQIQQIHADSWETSRRARTPS